MATFTHREVVSRRVEYSVHAAQPWGACLGDMHAAMSAAAAHYRREHDLPDGAVIVDDSLRFTPRDDEIVISFTIEEVAGRGE